MNFNGFWKEQFIIKQIAFCAFLMAVLYILPSGWERLKFFLMLMIPITLSVKHFEFKLPTFKKSLLFIGIFLTANMATFLMHVGQLKWELENPNGLFGWKINIDGLFSQIPFNNGMWLRQFESPIITDILVYIYIHGFVFCLLALCVYYLVSNQPNKILTAMFAGHFLQYILILPFHFWVDGHQVWWIQNLLYDTHFTDPISGYRTITEPVIPSMNHVFPSMHTSIATATIILALREQAKPLKYSFVLLNIAIIISTVYLGIHWVIDIFGGIIFGIVSVKVADRVMTNDWKLAWEEFIERVPVYLNPKSDLHLRSYSNMNKVGGWKNGE